MSTKIKIKRAYLQSALDIFQVEKIENQILNEKQIKTLVNLKVIDKWCSKMEERGELRVGDYVICITSPGRDYYGEGWELGYVFQITEVRYNHMCFGGLGGNGVILEGLRHATEEEIEQQYGLPF